MPANSLIINPIEHKAELLIMILDNVISRRWPVLTDQVAQLSGSRALDDQIERSMLNRTSEDPAAHEPRIDEQLFFFNQPDNRRDDSIISKPIDQSKLQRESKRVVHQLRKLSLRISLCSKVKLV